MTKPEDPRLGRLWSVQSRPTLPDELLELPQRGCRAPSRPRNLKSSEAGRACLSSAPRAQPGPPTRPPGRRHPRLDPVEPGLGLAWLRIGLQIELLMRWSPGPAPAAGVPRCTPNKNGSLGLLPRLPASLHTAAAEAIWVVTHTRVSTQAWRYGKMGCLLSAGAAQCRSVLEATLPPRVPTRRVGIRECS